MHLYLRNAPQRALILTTSSDDEIRFSRPRRALVLRATEGAKAGPKAVVEFLRKEDVDFNGVLRLTSHEVAGCLGLTSVGGELFLAVVTSASIIGSLTPNQNNQEQVSKIKEVAFFSLNTGAYDDLSLAFDGPPSPSLCGYEMNDNYDRNGYGQQAAKPVHEHPCSALSKIMSSGTFYYASDGKWDISSRLQVRAKRQALAPHDQSVFDPRFIWNEYIAGSLMDFRSRLDSSERNDFDACQFIILAIQGYVGLYTIPLPAAPRAGGPTIGVIGMISRLGWKRAGTRFNTRGVDDDGNVANFVETETLFAIDDTCWSYVQVRGSVPLFWEQQGFQIGGQRIQITRAQAASQLAFERHFAQLLEEYETVHIINLLATEENEAALTSAYAAHLQTLRAGGNADVSISNLDFHGVVRRIGRDAVPATLKGLEGVQSRLNNYGFTIVDSSSHTLITPQVGVFRTNCLDCLDRANVIQDIISKFKLEHYLRNVRPEWVSSGSLWSFHRELWADNGDALSRIYTGTGALNTSFTRTGKRTFAGLLSDATKSVARSYINNFQDKGKQDAIDLLLGNMNTQQQVIIFDPIHDSVRAALSQRLSEYSSPHQCQIFVGTWNLNGRPPVDNLLPWLFPRADSMEPDFFVLGFQELDPLTAQQIVQTDPEKKRMWESYIRETLATRRDRKSEYIMLRSEQLVGTALIVLCKTELTKHIRNVEVATKKTGLRGMSGNKGAVGIRLDYHNSSFCFITAHLAAGHINVEERNSDYRTIANGLSFLRGKTIGSHENVIWLADTNYRINLDNEEVRFLAVNDQLDALLEADQLKLAMDNQATFVGYEEGPLLFRPTYRYDLHSDEYDTSEKSRIPAWTDRVLYRGTGLDLAVYNRAELKQSDHRPVYAVFHAKVHVIDIAKRNTLQAQLLASVTQTTPDKSLDEKLAELTFKTEKTVIARALSSPPPPLLPKRPSHWNSLGPPETTLTVSKTALPPGQLRDPFDSDDDHSISLTDEELYLSCIGVPTEPTPKSDSIVRAWLARPSGDRPVSEVGRTSDAAPPSEAISSSTSVERAEIPASLKEGGLETAKEEEVYRPVSAAAVASMFEAKAKESTGPSRVNSAPASRSASGISRTALEVRRTSDAASSISLAVPIEPAPVSNSAASGTNIAASYLSNIDIFKQLLEHGCVDLSSVIDPQGYSSAPITGGGFGDIWKGRLSDGTEVAVKVWRFTCMSQDDPKQLKRAMREVYNWSKLKHENIHELMGVVLFRERLGMVSLWMGHGGLREYIGRYPDVDRYALCLQVAKGLSYLHSYDMVHGDLKAANVLVSGDGIAKLSDFGHSILSECTLVFSDTTNSGGTLRWTAPELLLSSEEESSPPSGRSKQSDIYALGMTFLEIITGEVPYVEYRHDGGIYHALNKRKPPSRPKVLTGTGRDKRMWELLLRSWEHEPGRRPSASEVSESLEDIVAGGQGFGSTAPENV